MCDASFSTSAARTAASAAAMSSGFGGFESFLCLDMDAAFHGVE